MIIEKYHIYMADTSRISIAGLNESNVEYFAKSLDEAVRLVQPSKMQDIHPYLIPSKSMFRRATQ